MMDVDFEEHSMSLKRKRFDSELEETTAESDLEKKTAESDLEEHTADLKDGDEGMMSDLGFYYGIASPEPVPDIPEITDEDFKRLVKKSFIDTIAMYKRLEKNGVRPSDLPDGRSGPVERIEEFLQSCPEPEDLPSSVPLHWLEYRFDGSTFTSPFSGLRIYRHPEDGRLLLPRWYKEWDEIRFGCCWGAIKSHQYLLLLESLCTSSDEPWKLDWEECVEYASSLAEKKNLYALSRGVEIDLCIYEVQHWRYCNHVLPQELEFYRSLFKSEKKNIHDKGKVWEEVQRAYPDVKEKIFEEGINTVYPSGTKRSSEELKTAMNEVENHYASVIKWNKEAMRFQGQYYKLKYAKALSLGIIKKNDEGFYDDNLDVSTWNLSDAMT